jgi:alginate O-acetyltransferase complex protein AlgI
MLFNSIEFAIFLPIIFILYWLIAYRSPKAQNLLLVFASYIFYAWWDWRFLSLIFFSSFVDYFVGTGLSNTNDVKKRQTLLWISVLVNLGFLGFFKYFNFFSESFAQAFTLMGNPINASRLNIILPVGISFYTFQTLSYSIDVYRRKLEPTRDIVSFFAFVSFFPQLVAGPIERAKNLLPQFQTKRTFEYNKAVDGMRQILWGLFKKIVIADNCATYANLVFNNSNEYSGSTLVLGALFFTFQIYGDFSGYSDIAIGTSRLFGINLMRNFAFPYFSRDIAEFWRKWHISLSSWFRDYLYIPMGGSQGGTANKVRNTFIIFIISGFWHGANWTFIVWGALNAIYFLPLLLLKRNRQNIGPIAEGRFVPSLREFIGMLTTFMLTVFAWIFFRAESVRHAITYIQRMISKDLFHISIQDIKRLSVGADIIYILILIVCFIIFEWIQREQQHGLALVNFVSSKSLRWGIYYVLIALIIFFQGHQQTFIYFQF